MVGEVGQGRSMVAAAVWCGSGVRVSVGSSVLVLSLHLHSALQCKMAEARPLLSHRGGNGDLLSGQAPSLPALRPKTKYLSIL